MEAHEREKHDINNPDGRKIFFYRELYQKFKPSLQFPTKKYITSALMFKIQDVGVFARLIVSYLEQGRPVEKIYVTRVDVEKKVFWILAISDIREIEQIIAIAVQGGAKESNDIIRCENIEPMSELIFSSLTQEPDQVCELKLQQQEQENTEGEEWKRGSQYEKEDQDWWRK